MQMDFGGDLCQVDEDDILLELVPSPAQVRQRLVVGVETSVIDSKRVPLPGRPLLGIDAKKYVPLKAPVQECSVFSAKRERRSSSEAPTD